MATSDVTTSVISTTEELQAFISSIPPSSELYLDLEGKSLSRHGTISIITILRHPERLIGLVDVQLMENASRTGDKTYLSGLEKAIRLDLKLEFADLNRWTRINKEITGLMSSGIFAV